MAVSSAPPDSPYVPYVGPRPIPANRALYGRERELRRLLDLLIPERIVLLYSPSGAGKTSLIQASLIPALREKELLVRAPIRVNVDPGIVLADDRPVNRYVLSTLVSLDEEPLDGRRRSPEELAGLDLDTYLEETRPKGGERQPEVLIFDQFEEILTLDPIDLTAKEELFRQLGHALRDPWRWALIAMREDYIAALDPYLPLLPTRLRARFRLDLLGERAAREAMQRPAEDVGYTFTDEAADKLLTDLLEVRLPRAGGGQPVEARGHYVEPVQLQVVCLRIWKQLAADSRTIDLDEVERWGNVDTALGDYYADSVCEIATRTAVPERKIRDWIEEQLTTSDGLRFQVVEGAGQTEGLNNTVLAELEHAHLVRREHHRTVHWYELTHDRLVRPIRESNAEWRTANLSLLEREADVWNRHERRDHLLVGGAALEEMERLAEEHGDTLGEVERAFLQECRQKRDEERRRFELEETRRRLREAEREQAEARLREDLAAVEIERAKADADRLTAEAKRAEGEITRVRQRYQLVLAFITLAVVGIGILPTLGVLTLTYKGQATSREIIAAARLLAVQAETLLDQYDLALLLALEAQQIDDSPETRGSLLTVIADKPRLTRYLHPPAGDLDSNFQSVAVSPDGRLVAAGGTRGDTVDDASPESGEVLLWDAQTGQPVGSPLRGHSRGLAFSPNEQLLASGRADGAVVLWDVTVSPARQRALLVDGQRPNLPPEEYRPVVTGLAFGTDGRTLAVASQDGLVTLWDVAQAFAAAGPDGTGPASTPSARFRREHTEAWSVALSPHGDRVVAGTGDGGVLAWDLATGAPVFELKPGIMRVHAVLFTPSGDRLVAGGEDGQVWLWDAPFTASATELRFESRNKVLGLAIDRAGERLAAAGSDGTAAIWELTPGAFVAGQSAPEQTSQALRAAIGISGAPDQPGLGGLPHLPSLVGHTDWVRGVAFGVDKSTLVTASRDRTAIAWDLGARWEQSLAPVSTHPLAAVAISPDNAVVAAADDSGDRDRDGDSAIRVWDLASRTLLAVLTPGGQDAIRSIAFGGDGRTLVSAGDDRAVIFWDWRSGTVRARPVEHAMPIAAMAVSPGGATVASASCAAQDGCPETEILLWNVQQAAVQHRLRMQAQSGQSTAERAQLDTAHADPWSLAFSPDGRWLAAGVKSGAIGVWSLTSTPSRDPSFYLEGARAHRGAVRGLAFSPDSQTLASTGEDGRVILWSLAEHAPKAESLVRMGRVVYGIAYQPPDGLLLAVGNSDGTVGLRDSRNGDRVGPLLRASDHSTPTVTFTSDGTVLASAGDDGRVTLWPGRPSVWRTWACQVANRNLTDEEWKKYLGERPYHQTCSPTVR